MRAEKTLRNGLVATMAALWSIAASAQVADPFDDAEAMREAAALDASTKSNYFAGRCLAPVLLREAVNTKDLKEMPPTAAVGHLFGEDGTVWYGDDDRIVLVDLSVGAACGINVFDEDLEDVEGFLAYWLEREDSPFTFTGKSELEGGNVQIAYDGFCADCGFDVHARAIWLRDSRFTIYRIFATMPEKN